MSIYAPGSNPQHSKLSNEKLSSSRSAFIVAAFAALVASACNESRSASDVDADAGFAPHGDVMNDVPTGDVSGSDADAGVNDASEDTDVSDLDGGTNQDANITDASQDSGADINADANPDTSMDIGSDTADGWSEDTAEECPTNVADLDIGVLERFGADQSVMEIDSKDPFIARFIMKTIHDRVWGFHRFDPDLTDGSIIFSVDGIDCELPALEGEPGLEGEDSFVAYYNFNCEVPGGVSTLDVTFPEGIDHNAFNRGEVQVVAIENAEATDEPFCIGGDVSIEPIPVDGPGYVAFGECFFPSHMYTHLSDPIAVIACPYTVHGDGFNLQSITITTQYTHPDSDETILDFPFTPNTDYYTPIEIDGDMIVLEPVYTNVSHDLISNNNTAVLGARIIPGRMQEGGTYTACLDEFMVGGENLVPDDGSTCATTTILAPAGFGEDFLP